MKGQAIIAGKIYTIMENNFVDHSEIIVFDQEGRRVTSEYVLDAVADLIVAKG